MYPIIFEIPLPGGRSLPVHGYGLMIVLGFLLLTWIAGREAKRRGLPEFAYDLGLTMLLCGLVGGRLFYYVQHYREQFADESLWEFFLVWKGGLVFYGGALGGLGGGAIYLVIRRLPILECLDVAAICSPIGMAFGRLGCFLNGCCYGKLCRDDYLLGVVFPASSSAHSRQEGLGLIVGPESDALPVHPVQLYQSAHDFMLFFILLWFLRRPDTPKGVGMPVLFGLYAIGRFCLEELRGDYGGAADGLTVSQNVSIVLGVTALILTVWTYWRALHPRSAKKNP